MFTALPKRLVVALLLLVAAGAAAVAFGLGTASQSYADVNPNTYDCRGHVEAGVDEPQFDAEGDTQVRYVFSCNGPILGYQIQSDVPNTGFDTETFGVDQVGVPVPADAFSCNGDFPGVAVNCLGTYRGSYDKVAGQYTIAAALCAEPRTDPLLTVFYATADAARKVTPAIAGPFDLGRPRGCPASKNSGKQRIPEDGFGIGDEPAAAPAAKKTTTTKKAATR